MSRRAQIDALIADLRAQFPALQIVQTPRLPEHSQGETKYPKQASRMRRLWEDPEYVLRVKNGHARANADPELRARRSNAKFQDWLDPEYRETQREAHVRAWEDPEKRANMERGLRGRKFPEAAKQTMREAQRTRRKREAAG